MNSCVTTAGLERKSCAMSSPASAYFRDSSSSPMCESGRAPFGRSKRLRNCIAPRLPRLARALQPTTRTLAHGFWLTTNACDTFPVHLVCAKQGFFLKSGSEVPAKSVLGRLMTGADDVTPGTADIVPSYIWINGDCTGIEEFTETAVLSSQYSQGLALLCAEETQVNDARRLEAKRDEDELLPELDGILKFSGRKSRK